MKYDFITIMDRHGRDSMAVDGLGSGEKDTPDMPKEGFDVIPMWVADMNFPTVPTVAETIIERAQHPAYGYFSASEEYYNSIIKWQQARNGVSNLRKKHIGYENGVLGGLLSVVTAFSAPGDAVLLHSPAYTGFIDSITNNGRRIVYSPLVKDEAGVWRMDYQDMDEKIKTYHIHVVIFCSPHNPCGRVWEKWEVERAMEVYKDNNCIVVSDEVWSDILLNGHTHTPTPSVSADARNRVVALYSPAKTFNLSGLVGAYHIIYNSYLKDRVDAIGSKSHYNNINVLSMHALIGAYKPEGYEWVDELCEVLSENIDVACEYIEMHFEGVKFFRPEGTYMLLLDLSDWCSAHGKTVKDVLKSGWEVGVAWQEGEMFQAPGTIRMNLALPYSRVLEALGRLKKYVFCPENSDAE